MARNFCINLYITEPMLEVDWTDLPSPSLTRTDKRFMHRHISPFEFKRAVSEMGAPRSPGPDGVLPLFYQKFWSTIGDSVVQS